MDYVADRIAWSERILANLAAEIGSALPRIISGLIIILLFLALAWVVRPSSDGSPADSIWSGAHWSI